MESIDVNMPQIDTKRIRNVLVLGRAGLDLYPFPDSTKIVDAACFTTDVGGSAGNIAVALARLGMKCGLLGVLSQDPVGHFVESRLKQFGVDTSLVQWISGDARTSLALAEVRPQDCDVVIYRNQAADLQLQTTPSLDQEIKQTAILVVTGTALVANPSRKTTLHLMKMAQNCGTFVVFDLDYRAYSWRSESETSSIYQEAAERSDLIVGNEEEFNVFAGNQEGRSIAEQFSIQKRKMVLLKQGRSGSILFLPNQQLQSGVYTVTSKKPYGAGDAFMGGLVSGLFAQMAMEQAIGQGSAAAAMVVAQRGCASAMPDQARLTEFIDSHSLSHSPQWITTS